MRCLCVQGGGQQLPSLRRCWFNVTSSHPFSFFTASAPSSSRIRYAFAFPSILGAIGRNMADFSIISSGDYLPHSSTSVRYPSIFSSTSSSCSAIRGFLKNPPVVHRRISLGFCYTPRQFSFAFPRSCRCHSWGQP